MRPASTLMALLPLVWLLLGAGTAASMNLTMTTPSQPRCFAGEIGGGVCEVKVYTACQTQSGEPDADKRKLKATRGMGDDDEPEPFPIPAPGVGKQQLFESGIPTDSIVTRHFAIGECAQRVSEAYHRNSIQYPGYEAAYRQCFKRVSSMGSQRQSLQSRNAAQRSRPLRVMHLKEPHHARSHRPYSRPRSRLRDCQRHRAGPKIDRRRA